MDTIRRCKMDRSFFFLLFLSNSLDRWTATSGRRFRGGVHNKRRGPRRSWRLAALTQRLFPFGRVETVDVDGHLCPQDTHRPHPPAGSEHWLNEERPDAPDVPKFGERNSDAKLGGTIRWLHWRNTMCAAGGERNLTGRPWPNISYFFPRSRSTRWRFFDGRLRHRRPKWVDPPHPRSTHTHTHTHTRAHSHTIQLIVLIPPPFSRPRQTR